MIHTGSKMYKFNENDELDIIRVLSSEESIDEIKYIDLNRKSYKGSYKEIVNSYRLLSPDGMIMFSIVNIGEAKDVVVVLKPFPITDDLPYAVCRQSISDFFTNNLRKSEIATYVGISVSKDTCPSNIDFKDVLSCTGVEYNLPVAIYIDDTLDSILSLFRHKKYDTTLRNLEIILKNNMKDNIVLGCSKTLKELLLNHNFMYDFRKCFHIMELPFAIDEDSDELSIDNIQYMSNELNDQITKTYVVRYSKEINLKEIKRKYVLAASAVDNYSKIYLVGYDVITA